MYLWPPMSPRAFFRKTPAAAACRAAKTDGRLCPRYSTKALVLWSSWRRERLRLNPCPLSQEPLDSNARTRLCPDQPWHVAARFPQSLAQIEHGFSDQALRASHSLLHPENPCSICARHGLREALGPKT